VKGLVVLTVVKPIRVTHLTVALHGFVRVFRSPSVRSSRRDHDPLLSPAGNGGKSQPSGNGQASLFQDEVTLCGEGRLEIGVYEFEFELEFPNRGLPTSIDVGSHFVYGTFSTYTDVDTSSRGGLSPT
jgi:arrestin-related trafficking adapter 9